MKNLQIILVLMLFLALVGWNVYLTLQITEYRKVEKELQLRLDVCDGDNMVIKDELVTTKDSIRILNKVIADKFKE